MCCYGVSVKVPGQYGGVVSQCSVMLLLCAGAVQSISAAQQCNLWRLPLCVMVRSALACWISFSPSSGPCAVLAPLNCRTEAHVPGLPTLLQHLRTSDAVSLQVVETRRKLEEDAGVAEGLEEARRRVAKELEVLGQRYAEKVVAAEKAEKGRARLQQELDDLSVELGQQRQTVGALERRQKKFDQVRPSQPPGPSPNGLGFLATDDPKCWPPSS